MSLLQVEHPYGNHKHVPLVQKRPESTIHGHSSTHRKLSMELEQVVPHTGRLGHSRVILVVENLANEKTLMAYLIDHENSPTWILNRAKNIIARGFHRFKDDTWYNSFTHRVIMPVIPYR